MNDVVTPPAPRSSAPPRSMPVFSVNIQLNTEFAQRVYRRCFDRLKGDLYVLTVRTLAGGMDEAAKAIENLLSEAFGKVRADLDSELERSDALLDDVKLTELANYDHALTTKATYSTPRAKEFLGLLLKMDQLLMRYDALWLLGHIEPQQRWTRCQNWQRRLTKVANRLRELGNRTKAGLTRETEKRKPATAETLERGLSDSTAVPTADEDLDGEDVMASSDLPDEVGGRADVATGVEVSTRFEFDSESTHAAATPGVLDMEDHKDLHADPGDANDEAPLAFRDAVELQAEDEQSSPTVHVTTSSKPPSASVSPVGTALASRTRRLRVADIANG